MLDRLTHGFILAQSACSTGVFGGSGPGLYDGLSCKGGGVELTSVEDFLVVIGNVVRILITLAGGLAIIFIIIGGIFYVISAGDPSRLKRAKEIITQAVIGLAIVSAAYPIVTFITGKL